MARLTWQNVAGPNFSGIGQAQYNAGQSLNKALTGIGDLFGSFDQKRTDTLNTAAMDELLKHTTPGEFDQLAKGGALSGLGIHASDASTDLMDLLYGRREALQGQRQSDVQNTTNLHNLDVSRGNQQWAGYQRDRAMEADTRADAQRDLRERIRNEAVASMYDYGSVDKAMLGMRDKYRDPEEQRIAMEALNEFKDIQFMGGKETGLSNEQTEQVQRTTEGLDSALMAQNTRFSLENPTARLFQRHINMSDGGANDPRAAMQQLMADGTSEDKVLQELYGEGLPKSLIKGLQDINKDSKYASIPMGMKAAALSDAIGVERDGLLSVSRNTVMASMKQAKRTLDNILATSPPGPDGRPSFDLERVSQAVNQQNQLTQGMEGAKANIEALIRERQVLHSKGHEANSPAMREVDEALAAELQAAEGLYRQFDERDLGANQQAAGAVPSPDVSDEEAINAVDSMLGNNTRRVPSAREQGAMAEGDHDPRTEAARDRLYGFSDTLDRALGHVGGAFSSARAWDQEVTAGLLAAFNPENADLRYRKADEHRERAAERREKGLFGSDKSEIDMSVHEYADRPKLDVSAAAKDPVAAIEQVVGEMGLDRQTADFAIDAVRTIQREMAKPTSKRNNDSVAQAREILSMALSTGSVNSMLSSRDLSESSKLLLSRQKEWLK